MSVLQEGLRRLLGYAPRLDRDADVDAAARDMCVKILVLGGEGVVRGRRRALRS